MQTMEDKNIVLIGFYVGDCYFTTFSKTDPFPQIAAFKLEQRFLEALGKLAKRVHVISSIAIQTFPRNRKLYFPASRFEHSKGVGKVVPILNLPVLKLVSRLSGTLYSLCKLKERPDLICIYAAHTPNLVATYLYSKISGTPYYVYMPDLPLHMDMSLKRSRIGRALKQLDKGILDWLIGRAHGLFVATKYMVLDNPVWRHLPYIVLEGIASEIAPPPSKVERHSSTSRVTLYAGGLTEEYGIVEIVEGFIHAQVPGELWICGRGPLEGYLTEIENKYPRIHYLGFLPATKIVELQAKADFLIVARNPSHIFTRYSFPSKLLEYLASGIPILTTKLDGIPEEYFSYLNIIEEYSVLGISNALRKYYSIDYGAVLFKARAGKAWVADAKAATAASLKIKSLICR